MLGYEIYFDPAGQASMTQGILLSSATHWEGKNLLKSDPGFRCYQTIPSPDPLDQQSLVLLFSC